MRIRAFVARAHGLPAHAEAERITRRGISQRERESRMRLLIKPHNPLKKLFTLAKDIWGFSGPSARAFSGQSRFEYELARKRERESGKGEGERRRPWCVCEREREREREMLSSSQNRTIDRSIDR